MPLLADTDFRWCTHSFIHHELFLKIADIFVRQGLVELLLGALRQLPFRLLGLSEDRIVLLALCLHLDPLLLLVLLQFLHHLLRLLFVDFSRLFLFRPVPLDLKSVLESVHACIILGLCDSHFKDALLRFELAELGFESRQCSLFIVDLVE